MSFVETYGPHLPYLRRFARALTGNQKDGDTYVRTALQGLASGAVEVDDTLPPKLALYQMFLGIWGGTGAKLEPSPNSPEGAVQKLTPRNRQAFLLNSMEGFSNAEIAKILRVDNAAVASLIAEANDDIERSLATNVLIIEDEPIIAADIEALVRELGHKVDNIATTRDEAVHAAGQTTPGLVLADVQLADGSSGIDAVHDILGEMNVPVIFITAFPERLLTGERPEPTYLISKPFQPNNVKAAISQALFFHS